MLVSLPDLNHQLHFARPKYVVRDGVNDRNWRATFPDNAINLGGYTVKKLEPFPERIHTYLLCSSLTVKQGRSWRS
jgi:hypothetical protein